MKLMFLRACCMLCLAVAPLWLASCGELANDASIVSVTITPDAIPESATGMTDEVFNIVIVTEGFGAPLESATVAIEEVDRTAEPEAGSFMINGNTVSFATKKSWFSGLEQGVYKIRATVTSEGAADKITRGNATTVTIN